MVKVKEWLTGFKSLGDAPNINATKFEIQTNKDTYITIWEYEIKTNTNDSVEYRHYENNVKDYCKSLDIEQLQYGFINILNER